MEPFWPEGTGIGRGFLSVFDTAWLVKRFIEEPSDKVYEVIREREKLYSLLRQTTDSSLKGNFKKWSINPVSRYPTTSFKFNQVGGTSYKQLMNALDYQSLGCLISLFSG